MVTASDFISVRERMADILCESAQAKHVFLDKVKLAEVVD